MNTKRKPIVWIADTLEIVRNLPDDVQDVFGYALDCAQSGLKYDETKPLKGFGSAKVLEIIENYNTDTYRAVYTVKFEGIVYVLHVFQKKSHKGKETPKTDIDLIRQRLRQAGEIHEKLKKEGTYDERLHHR